MKKPLISVIVPIYNIERYIGQCIESLIQQTYNNLQIILIDDGSTDRSAELCDLYAKKDSRIEVIHKENGGLVSARKTGIKIAKGEYIGYVDGDDWIEPSFFSFMGSTAIHTESDVVIAGFSRDLFHKTSFILNALPSGIYENGNLDNFYNAMISYGSFFRHGVTTYVWNKLFKKDCIYEPQLAVDDRITIGEDGAVTYPSLLRCQKICITDNCSYHYRQREDSMLKKTGNYHDEARRLVVLYNFLNSALSVADGKYRLSKQVSDYLLSTCIIRSGGILSSNEGVVYHPFNAELHKKRVVVCGAGTFGQQLVARILELDWCNLVGWVDEDYWEYRRCCLNVDDLDVVSELDFDCILVGMVDSHSVSCMIEKLLDLGVEEKKILKMTPKEEEITQILSNFIYKIK